jgi:hypothetical protein
VDRKVDPAFQDLLIDILVDYSSLFEREHGPTLARIASRLDYLSIDSETSVLLDYPANNKIGLNQRQFAVSRTDLEKYSRLTVLEVSTKASTVRIG